MTQIPIAGLVVLGILTLLGTAIFLDIRSWKKKELNDLLALEKEKTKPRYKLIGTTADINQPGFETLPLEPAQVAAGSDWCMTYSSLEMAKRLLAHSYERGYFEDKDGVTYPVCNIYAVQIVKAD